MKFTAAMKKKKLMSQILETRKKCDCHDGEEE